MRRRVTFEVTPTALFDRLAARPAARETIGARLLEVLLAESSWRTDVGLGFYGVAIVSQEELPEPAEPAREDDAPRA